MGGCFGAVSLIMPDFTATITGLTDARSGSLICWCSATPLKVTLLATIFAKFHTAGTGDVVVVTALVIPQENTGISSDRCLGWETYDRNSSRGSGSVDCHHLLFL